VIRSGGRFVRVLDTGQAARRYWLTGPTPRAEEPDVWEDYTSGYEGGRFAESARYVRAYPAELPVLADLLASIDTSVLVLIAEHDDRAPGQQQVPARPAAAQQANQPGFRAFPLGAECRGVRRRDR
jgi:hypothetical protein